MQKFSQIPLQFLDFSPLKTSSGFGQSSIIFSAFFHRLRELSLDLFSRSQHEPSSDGFVQIRSRFRRLHSSKRITLSRSVNARCFSTDFLLKLRVQLLQLLRGVDVFLLQFGELFPFRRWWFLPTPMPMLPLRSLFVERMSIRALLFVSFIAQKRSQKWRHCALTFSLKFPYFEARERTMIPLCKPCHLSSQRAFRSAPAPATSCHV